MKIISSSGIDNTMYHNSSYLLFRKRQLQSLAILYK